ncbi:MAG: glycogen debranching N-terminal domain-containing protein [Gammaproteobacteria bacterium]
MDDVRQIEGEWYVLASSSRTDDRTRVLKHAKTFCLFDRYGDIQHIGLGEQGIYHRGTRYLSLYELSVNNRRPMLLNSTVKQDNSMMTVDMTTRNLYKKDRLVVPQGSLHIFRAKVLWLGTQYEHLRFHNFDKSEIEFTVSLEFAADFRDIFEVRGAKRKQRGTVLFCENNGRSICLGYRGLDKIERYTVINFGHDINVIDTNKAEFTVTLAPREQKDFYVSVTCQTEKIKPDSMTYPLALKKNQDAMHSMSVLCGDIFSSNEQFNDWLNRSAADLRMLITVTKQGPYPYAGIPWFSTAFGRDGIITALHYLWLYPELAKGVLGFLAYTQATEVNPAIDAEPGKIFHETRNGEMSELGEVPFKLYYGTIDATPLFIVLAGEYYNRTGDEDFIKSIWPNIERALNWIDNFGDRDADGYVEYSRESDNGLVQQGWKDSDDSIFHSNGIDATGPIALSEVQGYVYQAKIFAAKFATLFGDTILATKLKKQAKILKKNFNRDFWCDNLSTFAIALDGNKKRCEVLSSNAGHVLFSGIANDDYAKRTAETLLSEDMFSGWGVRTIGRAEKRYNPMSYHNGSIWPHDNAMVAMGLARYGFKDKALQILTGLFNASIMMDLNRLPELFCGFRQIEDQSPTLYPVACSPQAWASSSIFGILQACLGISFNATESQVSFHYPVLPDYLQRLQITNLRIGDSVIDIAFRRHPNDVGINVIRKTGDVDVVVTM